MLTKAEEGREVLAEAVERRGERSRQAIVRREWRLLEEFESGRGGGLFMRVGLGVKVSTEISGSQ